MQKNSFLSITKLILIFIILLSSAQLSKAQSELLPYSYQFDQKFNASIYSVNNSFHTALKPFLVDSLIRPRYTQLLSVGVDTNRKSWVMRKIFNEHLFDVQNKEFTFYGDYLPDLMIGRDFSGKTNTYLNTRGYQFGGTVGTKFFFYTSGYENQGQFPNYLNNYINKISFIPGQAYNRSPGESTADWSYVTAILSYTPIKQLNITLGQDKTFIGDGYRSLLLSDFAANYPLLRLTANLGKVQYMMMWAYMQDMHAVKFDSFGSNRRKWGAYHYLDWNVTNRLSFGFFNSIIIQEADDKGDFHGFDLNYINPILFSNALNTKTSQPDNVSVGFTSKYKIFDKTAIYGQLLIDRFNASTLFSGGSENANGAQLGIRGADLFHVTNFNYLLEFNTVKPYTYASQQPITSYTFYSQPLGDPLGANFREVIGILNYSIGRFDFMGQLNYAKYGLDPTASANFGQDVNKPFDPSIHTTATIGQGLATSLKFAEGTVSFLINPKYNLRLEAGGLLRQEKNSQSDIKTAMFTFGLRSTFRGLYNDF
jgi:hypothetical protein